MERSTTNFLHIDNIDHLHNVNNIDKIESMEKPFDPLLSRMSKNQLVVLRTMLSRPENIITSSEIARRTGIVEKQLGGVLSAMSRKRVLGVTIIEVMGKDGVSGLRYKLNAKAVTIVLAVNRVKALIISYR